MDSIITFLNTMGKSFVDFSTSMLIQSSVLIVVLLALDLLLRKKVRAIFRYCIWMLVLVVAGLCVAGCTVGMSTKTSPERAWADGGLVWGEF